MGGPVANRLNAVEPRVALVTGLKARRDVQRRVDEVQVWRGIRGVFTVELHEDDRAVIGAKRRQDIKLCCHHTMTACISEFAGSLTEHVT